VQHAVAAESAARVAKKEKDGHGAVLPPRNFRTLRFRSVLRD
jgi:hypothetical protein